MKQSVPWIFLVGYAEEPDIYQLPIPSYEEYLDFARQYPGEYEVPEDVADVLQRCNTASLPLSR